MYEVYVGMYEVLRTTYLGGMPGRLVVVSTEYMVHHQHREIHLFIQLLLLLLLVRSLRELGRYGGSLEFLGQQSVVVVPLLLVAAVSLGH